MTWRRGTLSTCRARSTYQSHDGTLLATRTGGARRARARIFRERGRPARSVERALTVATDAATAIDYGADAFKVALVAPRVPFDVLLNRDSKRKTSSVVTLRGIDERLVGTDAAALATKLPRDAFIASKLLLGRHDAHAQTSLHAALFGANTLVRTERGTTAVGRSNASLPTVTAEELVAMQFSYAGEMAKLANGGDKVADVSPGASAPARTG